MANVRTSLELHDEDGWDEIYANVSIMVGNLVDDIHADAVRIAPEKSGHLKTTIDKEHVPGSLEGKVTVSASYWYFVEYGTKNDDGTERMRPQPFMRAAFFRKRRLHF